MRRRYRRSRMRRRRIRNKGRFIIFIVVVVLVVAAIVFAFKSCGNSSQGEQKIPEATPEPVNTVQLTAGQNALPSLRGFECDIMQDGTIVDSFTRKSSLTFGSGDEYTKLEGIITFRGNNYRDTASYGIADITDKEFDPNYWYVSTGSLLKSGGLSSWTGSGWTGQPLIVKWPDSVKQQMNLYEDKKAKEDLVEVIYATLDGRVYFMDLDDGTPTRDVLNIGMAFKGAGSLDPRGYPILYVGSGDPNANGNPTRLFVYSLIDFTKLYELGVQDTFAYREDHEHWNAYDAATLVSAKNDTLIVPGENGILYTVKLNTQYNPVTGELSMNPDNMVKWRYKTNRTSAEQYWYGMESSPVVWEHYIYMAANSGDLMCVDLDTMELVWSADILDDSNGTPIFEEDENGNLYIYVSTSLHFTADANMTGVIPIWKIDAKTGEKIWQKDYTCKTVTDVSGGVQSTGVMGKNSISDLVIYSIARTPNQSDGLLVALNKETGKEEWRFVMNNYAWSSPVAVYTEDGTAYIVQCDSAGRMFLLNGKTGELLDTIELGSNIEASPAVYENTIVVGTRGQKIVGVTLK